MASGATRAQGLFSIGVKKSIIGMRVMNNQRDDLGRIEDIVVDTRDSRVNYAILSFGGVLGVGDKHFAIPWQALVFDLSEKVAVLNIDRDRLANAPGFDRENWPDVTDAGWASSVNDYYGRESKPRDQDVTNTLANTTEEAATGKTLI
jgi:PRC-barrel domain protein